MKAKHLALALCILSFLQTSFAGFERFWLFSKDADQNVMETWDSMSDAEQAAVIKRYQSLKELPDHQSSNLQHRMDWFNQLPEHDKQHMREAWQKMSSSERRELAQRMQQAKPSERNSIRDEYLQKYAKEKSL